MGVVLLGLRFCWIKYASVGPNWLTWLRGCTEIILVYQSRVIVPVLFPLWNSQILHTWWKILQGYHFKEHPRDHDLLYILLFPRSFRPCNTYTLLSWYFLEFFKSVGKESGVKKAEGNYICLWTVWFLDFMTLYGHRLCGDILTLLESSDHI